MVLTSYKLVGVPRLNARLVSSRRGERPEHPERIGRDGASLTRHRKSRRAAEPTGTVAADLPAALLDCLVFMRLLLGTFRCMVLPEFRLLLDRDHFCQILGPDRSILQVHDHSHIPERKDRQFARLFDLVPLRSRETGNFVCHVTHLYLERSRRRCSLYRSCDSRLEELHCR